MSTLTDNLTEGVVNETTSGHIETVKTKEEKMKEEKERKDGLQLFVLIMLSPYVN